MQSSQSGTVESLAHSSTWSRNNPYSATVLENRLLTGSGSEKETRHIELDLGDSSITYLPGDSAGILPINACDAVDLVLERLQLTGTEPVTDFYGKPLDLRQALTSWLMIGKVSGSTLKAWAKHTGNPELSDIAANREKLDAYLWAASSSTSSNTPPPNSTTPSSSSKSSPASPPASIPSPRAGPPPHPHRPPIRVVKYETHGRDRYGVCSTHVGERTPKGEKLPIFIHSNQLFRLPASPTRASSSALAPASPPSAPSSSTSRQDSRPLAHVALLRRPARLSRTSSTRRTSRPGSPTAPSTASTQPFPATRKKRSTSRPASAKTQPSSTAGSTKAPTSTSAETQNAWPPT